jgi:hypothetical protein
MRNAGTQNTEEQTRRKKISESQYAPWTPRTTLTGACTGKKSQNYGESNNAKTGRQQSGAGTEFRAVLDRIDRDHDRRHHGQVGDAKDKITQDF